jgi:hypothetical protein
LRMQRLRVALAPNQCAAATPNNVDKLMREPGQFSTAQGLHNGSRVLSFFTSFLFCIFTNNKRLLKLLGFSVG